MNPFKNSMLHLAGITMIGMPIVAYIIDSFADSFTLRERIFIGDPIWVQVGIGLLAGVISGFIAYWISSRPFIQKSSSKYNDLISQLKLNKSEIIFISICAGFGEEILFRGAIQPLIGIIPTAVFFVAVHGYLNPRDWRISVYGLIMTVIICGFGYLTERYGIWTAIVAHAMIDVILLWKMDGGEEELEDFKA